MKSLTQDSPAIYRTDRAETGRQLRFDRGTLLLEGVAELPAGLESSFQYDPRVEAYRAPAHRYSEIIGPLKGELARNKAPRYQRRELIPSIFRLALGSPADVTNRLSEPAALPKR